MTSEFGQDKEIKQRHLRIGLMETTVSGKSVIAEHLSANWEAEWVKEDFGENPFLERFCKNRSEYSFMFQCWSLERKIDQLSKLNNSKITIIDPALEVNWIHAKTDYLMGWMNEDEWNLYNNLYGVLKSEKNIVDSDIYLVDNAPKEVLFKRIRKGAGNIELQTLDNDMVRRIYLPLLLSNMQKWCWGKCPKTNSRPVVPINSVFFDMAREDENIGESLVKDVENWIRYHFVDRREIWGGENLILPEGIKRIK